MRKFNLGEALQRTAPGVIINDGYVLTAAHCVDGADPGDFEVLIGTDDLTAGGQRVGVRSILDRSRRRVPTRRSPATRPP